MYNQAIAALEAIQNEFPRAIRPKQLQALALNRRAREVDLARTLIRPRHPRGNWTNSASEIQRPSAFTARHGLSGTSVRDFSTIEQSRDLYAEAFQGARDDYYSGMNAASKSVLIGGDTELAKGRALASDVQKIVGMEPAKGDYWKTATAAEASLAPG